MSLILETIHTEGVALLSYLVGDDRTGEVAVIDPRPDCDIYLHLARRHGVAITHLLETHIHADFMSGARELSRRLGSVPIHTSHAGGARYGFDTEPVEEGQKFAMGDVVLTARHTPGHTPEHLSFFIAEAGRKEPFGVFSGDTLFVDSVGRPDLLGEEKTEELAGDLFRSLNEVYGGLDDSVLLFPGHGAGSACGPNIGDRNVSTMGYERRFNPFLGIADPKEFAAKVLHSAPPEPRHYRPMKRVNAEGPKTFGGPPPVPALPAKAFKGAVQSGHCVLLDTRDMLSFGGGHIHGALNIAGRSELSVWAGQMIGFDEPILLVLEQDDRLGDIVNLLWRTAHTNFAGYLAGGMDAWETSGEPFEELHQMEVHELRQRASEIQVVDVRSPAEWKAGHIPGAQSIFVSELRERTGELDPSKPVVTYCGSGFRANIAASILKQEGFPKVCNVPGSLLAWKCAGYPLEEAKT